LESSRRERRGGEYINRGTGFNDGNPPPRKLGGEPGREKEKGGVHRMKFLTKSTTKSQQKKSEQKGCFLWGKDHSRGGGFRLKKGGFSLMGARSEGGGDQGEGPHLPGGKRTRGSLPGGREPSPSSQNLTGGKKKILTISDLSFFLQCRLLGP